MRILLLFRGAPGCGKSTFIEKNGLKPYTLSADEIRTMYQSPTLTVDGTFQTTLRNDDKVWDLLMNVLEERMIRGEFIVVDATNSKTEEMNKYRKYAEKYRYRKFIIDMTDLPIEECIRRNNQRPEVKRVPEVVIERMYARFETQKIPSGYKIIKPDELDSVINFFKPLDLNKYKKIHHIGDIHGCYTALKEYIGEELKDDEFYIFLGDYLERGLEDIEVLKFLLSIYNKSNVMLLTGNHELYLWNYANNIPNRSRFFQNVTKPILDSSDIDKKDIRMLYRSMGQIAYYVYGDKKVFCCHGGISKFDEKNIAFISTDTFIRGVGKYEDILEVDQNFEKNTPGIYQIHGHRNTEDNPVQITDRCFNLEGHVETGGHLRAVELDENGFTPIEIKNTVFRNIGHVVENNIETPKNIENSDNLALLRADENIIERVVADNISSFNFNRKAFNRGIWNEQTIKARGLFVNTNTGKVVARSFNKFFNMEEKEFTKISALKENLKFPLKAYVKYNGFLGIIGYDEETDKILLTTKAFLDGPYRDMFNNIYNSLPEESRSYLENYIKENNCSAVWEVIDPKNDGHIIEYDKPQIVLIALIKNNFDFDPLDYETLVDVATKSGVKYKELAFEFEDFNSFMRWRAQVMKKDYKYKDEYIEGFVLEDANHFMFKLKLYYYSFWKQMRNVAKTVANRGCLTSTNILHGVLDNRFYAWLRNQDRKTMEPDKIIDLRNKFYEEYRLRGEDPDDIR